MVFADDARTATMFMITADARGVIAGLTRFVNKGHLARAVLEASAYQTLEIVEAMNNDSGVDLSSLKGRRRDGGQRAAHAVSGGHPGRSGHPAGRHRNHRFRGGLRGRACRGLLVRCRTAPEQLGG